jgi:putative transposase
MTDERMALVELIEKGADADLIREMLAFAAERLMELEVEARTGAPCGVRSPDRQNKRNGYRERPWQTPENYRPLSAGETSRLFAARMGLCATRF